MSRRKSHVETASHGQTVRVDDVLVRNHRVRQRVHKMVAASRAQDLSVEDARRMAVRIQKRGQQAVQALFDCLFDDENQNNHRLAVMLLSEMNDPAVFDKIHQMLNRPQLPEKVRVALLAIEAIHEGGPAAVTEAPSVPGLTIDSLLQFTENFWETMEMEEIALMWRENFIAEPAEDRLVMLEVLMKSAHPKTLGIARLEIAMGDLKILQFLAEKLADFDGPLAGSMLESLLGHVDVFVRTTAEASLNKWRARAASRPLADQTDAALPRFYRAHMATDEWSGHYSLVYSVKAPDDTIKFVVVLFDRWDRGVIDCWGCVRYSEAEFEQLLGNMAADFADLHQERISKRTALTLLFKATDLNIRRKHPLPLEFSIWSHLFEHEQVELDPKVPKFGVDCGICHKHVRTGPRIAQPWVFGELVVCHRCSKRTLRCPTCDGSTTLAECFLTRKGLRDQIDLKCPHCFESLHMPL